MTTYESNSNENSLDIYLCLSFYLRINIKPSNEADSAGDLQRLELPPSW